MALSLSSISSVDLLSGNNVSMSVGTHTLLTPILKGRPSTATLANTSYNSVPMGGLNNLMVDGDLIFVPEWGYGVTVYRLNDNGTANMVYREAVSEFGSTIHNFGLNTVRKKFYVGYYPYNQMREYDYSGCWPTGSTVTKNATVLNSTTTSLPYLAGGYPYMNGFFCAGDYLYLNRYNSHAGVDTVERWNTYSNTYSTIAVVRGRGGYVYNGGFTYDPMNDRLYQLGLSGQGCAYCITDASTSTANAFQINFGASGGFGIYDAYGECYPDGNTIIIWAYNTRLAKFDITNCLKAVGDGAANAIPSNVWFSPETNMVTLGWTGCHGIFRPPNTSICLVHSDRAIGRFSGWVDQDTGVVVALSGAPIYQSSATFQGDYGSAFKRVITAGGTPYWIHAMYWGGPLSVWPDSLGPRLENTWETVFGPYSISGSPVAYSGLLAATGYTVPSGCSLTFYVSSDAGVNWQTVTPGTTFDLSIPGTAVRVKIVGTGTDWTSAYIKSSSGLQLALTTQRTGFTPDIAQRFKLAGAN